MRRIFIALIVLFALSPDWSEAQDVSFALEIADIATVSENKQVPIPSTPRFEELTWFLAGSQEMGVESVNFGEGVPARISLPEPNHSLIHSLWPISQRPELKAWGNFSFNIAFNR